MRHLVAERTCFGYRLRLHLALLTCTEIIISTEWDGGTLKLCFFFSSFLLSALSSSFHLSRAGL